MLAVKGEISGQSIKENLGVLIIDDEFDQYLRLSRALERAEFGPVRHAADGLQALVLLQTLPTPPDVVILDLQMPVMDGVEFMQKLEESTLRPSIMIVTKADPALTESVATMVEAMGFPYLGTFQKPCATSAIAETVAHHCEAAAPTTAEAPPHAEIDGDLLYEAIKNASIFPYYQPKIDIQTGQTVGVEALARWRDNSNHTIAPNAFIPMAERKLLINDLTSVILKHVLNDMGIWNKLNLSIPVSINISPTSLNNREFTHSLIKQIERRYIPAELITFEITESALLSNASEALANTNRMRLKNFSFAIDDYGTGFSGLKTLSQFPFTELKIDRSFVAQMQHSDKVMEILQSSIDMGKKLGMTTVAEGVETEAQLKLLADLHCDVAQGDFLSEPMPAHSLISWIIDSKLAW